MKRKVMSSLALLLLLLSVFVNGQFITVDLSQEHHPFIDEDGRQIVFHGVNVVYKEYPWIPRLDIFDPLDSVSQEDIDNLKFWGFNCVRLGVMWPGVETSPGKYNATYIQSMVDLVHKFGKNGIYTIVDLHQDLLSPYFCGEGIPDFYFSDVNPDYSCHFPEPLEESYPLDPKTGYPLKSSCAKKVFGWYYLSNCTGKGFQDLYDNSRNIQDGYLAYWDYVSSMFKDSQYVLGYEVLNEPFAGDIYKYPELLLPGKADRDNLFPLYTKACKEIRKNDANHIVFYEKALTDVQFVSPGFSGGPCGTSNLNNSRQAYSYHVYCGGVDSDGNPDNLIECTAENILFLYKEYKEGKKLGGGTFLTEFGAVGNKPISALEISTLVDAVNSIGESWTYWQFKKFHDVTTSGSSEGFYDGQGNLEKEKVAVLSRPYAMRISGNLYMQTFNPENLSFFLSFEADPNIKLPSIIYLNQEWIYENGFEIQELKPDGSKLEMTSDSNHFALYLPTELDSDSEQIIVSLRIIPK